RCVAVSAGLICVHNAGAQTAASLNRIHTIQVAAMGEGSSAEALRQRITDRLGRSGRLTVVDSASAADVTLRGTSSIWATGTISLNPHTNSASQTIYEGYLSIELVSKRDEVLWS